SPKGSLTREEVDVTDHFDTLALPGVLPSREVGVGDTWKIPNPVAQALCHFQALSENTLEAKLDEVKDGLGKIGLRGTASGIDQGAAVKAEVTAVGVFDFTTHCLIDLEWTQKDERQAGPVNPASALALTVKMKRIAVEPINELGDVALVPVPAGA